MRLLSPEQAKLGFIGMGAMGSLIARRLHEHGYQVAVYDRTQSKAAALLPYGVAIADSVSELVANVDVVLSCLTNDDAIRSVYLGDAAGLAAARPGTVVLEMSTVSPSTSRELNRLGAKRGVDVMDIAISGTTKAVK